MLVKACEWWQCQDTKGETQSRWRQEKGRCRKTWTAERCLEKKSGSFDPYWIRSLLCSNHQNFIVNVVNVVNSLIRSFLAEELSRSKWTLWQSHQWNRLTAPQPQGPMVQDHLMTTETRGEDLILPQALKMINRWVPFYYDSFSNNTSKELQSGSIPFGMNPICKLARNMSELIAWQVPCQSDLFLKHKVIVKTLLLDIRITAFSMQSTLNTERLENLYFCGKCRLNNLEFSFLI